MSLKNVRKLLNETNDIKLRAEDGDDDADDVCIPVQRKSKKKKPISALLLMNEDDEIDTFNTDDEVDVHDSDHDVGDGGDDRGKFQNKVSKKASKRKQKNNLDTFVEDDVDDNGKEEVDIDTLVDEVNKILGPVTEEEIAAKSDLKVSKICDVLRVDGRHLNFYDEYRSIKEAERVSTAMAGSRSIPGHFEATNTVRDPRTGRMKLQPNQTRTKLMPKSWLLINPRRHEGFTNPGISMDIDESIKNVVGDGKSGNKSKKFEHFKIKYNQDYQAIQIKFLDLVGKDDTEELINLMNDNPSHIESLINASALVAKEDSNMAFELIQKCLLIYEKIFHVKFNPRSKICQLNYKRPENRPFFVALFKFMMFSVKFQCIKTGLEVAKLLLSLDYEMDPLSVMLIIDYIAINAKNYDFLIQLFNAKDEENENFGAKIRILPNMILNTALAYLMKSLDKTPKNVDAEKVVKLASSERQTLFNKSNELLQEAIFMFPSILRPFLESMSIQVDDSVRRCPYFYVDTTVDYPLNISPLLHDMINIFIERNANIWKSIPDILLWLETNVKIVIQRLDADPNLVSMYNEKRYKYYPLSMVTPRNVFRHVFLSGIKKVRIPKDIFLSSSVSDAETDARSNIQSAPMKIAAFDPIPPIDTDRKSVV